MGREGGLVEQNLTTSSSGNRDRDQVEPQACLLKAATGKTSVKAARSLTIIISEWDTDSSDYFPIKKK